MNTFRIEITETLQRVVEVNASSEKEAINKVMDMYKNEEVVLDSNDFIETDFASI